MKYRILFLLLPLTLLFTSCSNEEEEPVGKISFQTSDSLLRASEIDADNMTDFRVWTIWTRADTSTPVYMDGVKVERINNSSPWTYSPVLYWPTEGKLDFYAYSPAASSGVLNFDTDNLQLTYDVTTDLARQEDFVITSALNPAKNVAVTMNFEHLLSQATFVTNNKTGETVVVKRIEVKGLYRQGKFLFTAGDWDDQEIPTAYTIPESEYLMVLPQTTPAPSVITVTYDVYDSNNDLLTDNIAYDIPFSDFTFEKEKKYTFYLELTQTTK